MSFPDPEGRRPARRGEERPGSDHSVDLRRPGRRQASFGRRAHRQRSFSTSSPASTRASSPKSLVGLATPADTPSAGSIGSYGDGAERTAFVTLSASGRRLFIETSRTVCSTPTWRRCISAPAFRSRPGRFRRQRRPTPRARRDSLHVLAVHVESGSWAGSTLPPAVGLRGPPTRWTHVIVGDLPDRVDGELIDDVLILARRSIDARQDPRCSRPHACQAALGEPRIPPREGLMSFDAADLAKSRQDRTLNDVIAHEIGHVLGIERCGTARSS